MYAIRTRRVCSEIRREDARPRVHLSGLHPAPRSLPPPIPPFPPPAMSQTPLKKLQAKIFRGQNGEEVAKDGKPTRSSSDPALTINIPNPNLNESSQPGPAPPKMAKTESTGPNEAEEDLRADPFRQRLSEKLGPEYHGAERFRLDQDGRREHHWKRWGPYLSDRQWVRCVFASLAFYASSGPDRRAYRPPSARITQRTAMHGAISLTNTLVRVYTGGVRMVWVVSPTTTSVFVSDSRSGMVRIAFSRNASLASPATKGTMAKT